MRHDVTLVDDHQPSALQRATDGRREPILSLTPDDGFGAAVSALLVAVFAAQWLIPSVNGWALSPGAIADGRWSTLFTHMLVHAGWLHLFMNVTALWSLARELAGRISVVRLAVLFVASGLAGGALYLILNLGDPRPMVGASGAICGLWGNAARFNPRGPGMLPLRSRPVLDQIRRFAIMNVVLFGLLWLLSAGQGGLAWEAHLGGFLLGLLAAPLLRGRSPRGLPRRFTP